MLDLFKADLFRIFRKKGFYYYTLFCTVAFTGLILMIGSKNISGKDYFTISQTIISMSSMLIGIFLYSLLYGDDMKSKNSQAVLGHGYTRAEVVIYKLITFTFLTILAFSYLYLIINLNALVFSFDIKQFQEMLIKISIVSALKVLSYAALTNIVAYFSQSSSSSIVVFVLLSSGTVNLILGLLLSQNFIINIFGNLQVYLIESLSSTTLSTWLSNRFTFNKELLILLGYLIVNSVLAIQVFKNKELEF